MPRPDDPPGGFEEPKEESAKDIKENPIEGIKENNKKSNKK